MRRSIIEPLSMSSVCKSRQLDSASTLIVLVYICTQKALAASHYFGEKFWNSILTLVCTGLEVCRSRSRYWRASAFRSSCMCRPDCSTKIYLIIFFYISYIIYRGYAISRHFLLLTFRRRTTKPIKMYRGLIYKQKYSIILLP